MTSTVADERLLIDWATRTDEAALARQFGLRLSRDAVLLDGLTVEEQTEIQRNPLLMSPERCWRDRIVPKIENPANWTVVRRPAGDLEIYLCDSSRWQEPPARYRALWRTTQQADHAYRRTAWTLTALPGRTSKVLNIGCATGHEVVLIREDCSTRTVFSIDMLHENATSARAVNTKSVSGSALSLPYRTETFDAIYSNHVLEHFFDVDTAIAEMHRVLVPSGIAISVLPTETNASNPFAADLMKTARRWSPRRIDAGHPFKTDLHDLFWRFKERGFRRVLFVYDVCDLAARMTLSGTRTQFRNAWRRQAERVLSALQSSSTFFTVEYTFRKAVGLWRFRNYPLWLVKRLRLPDKGRETLEVACIAYK
jgi:SAM-dependent methyltransferase